MRFFFFLKYCFLCLLGFLSSSNIPPSARHVPVVPSSASRRPPPPAFICPSFFRVTFRATQTESKPVWGRVELTSLRAPPLPRFTTHPPDDQYEKIHKGINGVLRKEIQSVVTAGRRPSFRHVCVCAFVDECHAALCGRARSVFAKATFFFVAFGKNPR